MISACAMCQPSNRAGAFTPEVLDGRQPHARPYVAAGAAPVSRHAGRRRLIDSDLSRRRHTLHDGFTAAMLLPLSIAQER